MLPLCRVAFLEAERGRFRSLPVLRPSDRVLANTLLLLVPLLLVLALLLLLLSPVAMVSAPGKSVLVLLVELPLLPLPMLLLLLLLLLLLSCALPTSALPTVLLPLLVMLAAVALPWDCALVNVVFKVSAVVLTAAASASRAVLLSMLLVFPAGPGWAAKLPAPVALLFPAVPDAVADTASSCRPSSSASSPSSTLAVGTSLPPLLLLLLLLPRLLLLATLLASTLSLAALLPCCVSTGSAAATPTALALAPLRLVSTLTVVGSVSGSMSSAVEAASSVVSPLLPDVVAATTVDALLLAEARLVVLLFALRSLPLGLLLAAATRFKAAVGAGTAFKAVRASSSSASSSTSMSLPAAVETTAAAVSPPVAAALKLLLRAALPPAAAHCLATDTATMCAYTLTMLHTLIRVLKAYECTPEQCCFLLCSPQGAAAAAEETSCLHAATGGAFAPEGCMTGHQTVSIMQCCSAFAWQLACYMYLLLGKSACEPATCMPPAGAHCQQDEQGPQKRRRSARHPSLPAGQAVPRRSIYILDVLLLHVQSVRVCVCLTLQKTCAQQQPRWNVDFHLCFFQMHEI